MTQSKASRKKSTRPANANTASDGALCVDVLVNGGGLVGGTLASALAQGGLSVCVVDRDDPAHMVDAGFDGRCSAIALSSQRLLDGVGLWDFMSPRANPIDDIRVSDQSSAMYLHYDHRELGDDSFGFMVENRDIRRALFDAMPAQNGLHLFAPAQIETLNRDASGVQATLNNGQEVQARLVIGAEGRRSFVRDHARIPITQWSYHQVGIVCTVEHEIPHHNIAQEQFLPSGPFAILPLVGEAHNLGRCSSIVWTEREDLADVMMRTDEATFNEELALRFGDFLGDVNVLGNRRWAYPLSLQYAHRAVDTRLALAGDAYHGMHPIAGQGLNMGLRDVAALAEVLVDGKRNGADVGSDIVLDRYESWRRFDNHLMLAMTDVLNRLFSNDIAPIKLARDLGLAAVNQVPPLKKVFMQHAMGVVGELPRLMRGESL